MKTTDRSGTLGVERIARAPGRFRVACGALCVLLLAGCSDAASPEPAETPPAIEHLGVEYGPYDAATGMAGAFDFASPDRLGRTGKQMVEFGANFVWGDCPPECGTTGHMLYRLPPDAHVYAPIDGYVARIGYDSAWDDYEIDLNPRQGETFWFVVIDHVLNVRVEEGDRVEGGEWLATPGNAGLEIDLSSQDGRLHCMLSYLDPAVADAWKQKVADYMSDWEAFVGDASLYDQAAMVQPGCLTTTVRP